MQRVKRVFDLLGSQARITLFMACNHVVSISAMEFHDMRAEDNARLRTAIQQGGTFEWSCHHCPDAPLEEVRLEKTATQLWKEAGEP